MLRIKISRQLERQALREVRARLKQRREEWPEYRDLWRRVLERRPLGMSRADYLRFRLLDRQFDGKFTPLLPSAVRVARFVVKRVPRLKRRLEGNG